MNIKVTINNNPSQKSMENFMTTLNQIIESEKKNNSVLYKQFTEKYNGNI